MAMAMDMDMDSDMKEDGMSDISNSKESTHTTMTDTSVAADLTPIPHVMKHPHGLPILETNLLPEEKLFWENYNTTTYFTVPSNHRAALYMHIALGLVSIIVVYPIALIFNNLSMTKTYMAALVIHTGFILISLLNYSIFINLIPELYPGNAYGKMIVILFITTCMQLVFALVKNLEPSNLSNGSSSLSNGPYFSLRPSTSGSDVNNNNNNNGNDNDEDEDEDDGDNVSESSLINSSAAAIDCEKMGLTTQQSKIYRFRMWISQTKFHKFFKIGFNLLNWGHFFYYLVLIPTGVATFCMYGQAETVFNLLAHFIKGGVFFAYGILSLARYCGAFSNKGWAWNHKFISGDSQLSFWSRFQNKGLWTMEMIESSLILFYGSTNIFLEHLSNAGNEWSTKDLQHVSIAFIFIGCGLCGVLTELKLQDWRYEQALANYKKIAAADDENIHHVIKASPGFSPNPFPVLTIYWTGILMSLHQQASALSTEIHVQWGNMFILGCAFRFITYLLMLLNAGKPTKLTRPVRPITELIVAFSLICGGLIFMESTDPVVLSFEYYGLTSMFTLNVSLGVVTLLMSWMMSLFTFKDWLKNKYKVTQHEV